jgi:ABC-type antimicrobial peptide transport system permease subunit
MSSIKNDIIKSLIAMSVVLALMSICMYFIMRSSLMNRIKEIGIYRAIGASKKNLTFRFLIESMVLSAYTVFKGFVLSSVFIWVGLWLSSMLENVFFYPVWYGLIVLAVLIGLCLICGIIPIISLLRKTPSQILAKYDI